jgi:hypothetical protein
MEALRSTYWVNESVCGDAASAGSTSPVSWWCRAATLSGISSWTACRAARADRQLLVGDGDPLGGVLGDVPVGRHHHHDRLADVVDLAVGQRVAGARRGQLRVRDEHGQRLRERAGEVLVGVDGDQALDVEGGVHVDVDDAGVRVRAAHEGGGQRAAADVVEVAAAAGDEPGVLPPADRLAEQLGGHRAPPSAVSAETAEGPAPAPAETAAGPAPSRIVAAAWCTAFLMFA